jgi:integrase
MSSRARNKLTVKQLAALSKPGIYSDGGGLYLRIRASGRSWFYIGTLHGKRIELGLGSDLDVTLARAREKAEKVRAMLLDGQDPREERRQARLAAKPVVTFGAFAMEMLDGIEDGFKNPKHRQQWRNTLITYGQPLFDLPIEDVATAHVLEVLQPIWLTKAETASRVRGRIERVLDTAKAKGLREGDNPARLKGNLAPLLPKRDKAKVKHHAALPFVEVAAFMADLRKRPAVAARALEITVLTAARSGEVRGMTWGEIDLKAKLWTVPATRMKAGEEHQVPLSEAAIAVLNAVNKDGLKADDFVFPAPRGGSLSDMALSQLLKRMDRKNITVHGFRSTFRDWAGDETTFEREVIEMALAHRLSSAVEAAYRRGTALGKRRELMITWAEYCLPQQTFKQFFGRNRRS